MAAQSGTVSTAAQRSVAPVTSRLLQFLPPWRVPGAGFMKRWREDKLGSLYTFISRNMPVGNPESQLHGIHRYRGWILSINEIPAGNQDLTPSAASAIQVVGKERPAPGSRWLACRSGSGAWCRTRPTRGRSCRQQILSVPRRRQHRCLDIKALSAKPLGSLTFGLPDVVSISRRTTRVTGLRSKASSIISQRATGPSHRHCHSRAGLYNSPGRG